MSDDEEIRTLRNRVRDIEDLVKRRNPDNQPGANACVVRTVTVTTYPTTASTTYGVKRVLVSGDETEGAAVTRTLKGLTFYAKNLGTAVPVVGTDIVVTQADGRWVFRFDG